ncbi:Chlorophyll a-b binding protein of LHCII type III [Tripterygium wilfordii]|uniref:Chlorophyll a-b binding protein of LHCII type III n=1 Tax=Tripterygium wilfordii TaxID=458696 RepID=A0A7J7C526_TRIWF|nr:Chlorophyll a-b binding protein of LHCII type III [Tripterygium wilfordii]
MENTVPLHACQVHKLLILFNRAHLLLHFIALACLVYYRAFNLFHEPETRTGPILPRLPSPAVVEFVGKIMLGASKTEVISLNAILKQGGSAAENVKRIEALEPLGIYLPGDINYLGGALFDLLNFTKDPVAFEELKVKEIRNEYLAIWLPG